MLVATAPDERLILEDGCSVHTLCARAIAAPSTSGLFWGKSLAQSETRCFSVVRRCNWEKWELEAAGDYNLLGRTSF